MNKKYIIAALFGLFGCFQTITNFAATLDFVPTFQTVGVGQSASVDIFISGLDDENVGAFDFDVSYDATILTATGVTFGPFLGAPTDSLTSFDLSTPGIVDLAENSLLSPLQLVALQPGTFLLATISFDALMIGVSPLNFASFLVIDEDGIELNVGEPDTAAIAVVPEPSTLALFATVAICIIIVGFVKRKR